MDDRVFNRFREIVYEKCGISLGENKKTLVSARLGKRMRALNMADFKDYLEYLTDDENEDEIVSFLDAISTNVTHFFREEAHFHFLKDMLKEWAAIGQTRFRLWSAACSSGEEPYTMAFTADEALGLDKADIKILATDISTKVLEKAINARYAEPLIVRVPEHYRKKYFIKTHEKNKMGEDIYTIPQAIKDSVVIRRFNLSEFPYALQGPLDMIFCRNVMIYFDRNLREKMVKEFTRILKPGGFLVVGHTESLIGIAGELKTYRTSIYRKP